jgi:hypothetical protein
MQRSDEGGPEQVLFQISGVLSEWLFATNFWQNFNKKYGTMFDQFEEDDANPKTLELISESLIAEIEKLGLMKENQIRFIYRWGLNGEKDVAIAPRSSLQEELRAIRKIFNTAADQGQTLSLSL